MSSRSNRHGSTNLEDDGTPLTPGEEADESEPDNNSRQLNVVVKRVGHEHNPLKFDLDPDDSVLDLKNLISVELAIRNDHIPIDRLRLIYFGRLLGDDAEVLGSKGVNLQPESVNYVHLSPLPEGATRSNRSSSRSLMPAGPTMEGAPPAILSQLERAHRLGVAARERRRLRRQRPYPDRSGTASASQVPVGEEAAAAGEPILQGLLAQTVASASLPQGSAPLGHPPSHQPFLEHIIDLPMAISQGSSLPPVFAAPPRVEPMASASTPSEVQPLAANLIRASLTEHARHASSDLVASLAILQEQLQTVSRTSALTGLERNEASGIISNLERISRETLGLSRVLHALQTDHPGSGGGAGSGVRLGVPRLYMAPGSIGNQPIALPDAARFFFSGSSMSPMM